MSKDNQPLVSIITITHNRANLIQRCIESIKNQTYQNYEHIIIDGLSTDNTEEVVKSYNDNRIIYMKSEVNNVPQNHWKGIYMAKGKYVTFLDDDDEYLPTKVEKQVRLFESLSPDYGIVYCWMSYYDNSTKKLLKIHKSELRGNILVENVESPKVSGTPTMMFKTQDVIKHNLGYREDIGYHSDWEYITRACRIFLADYVPESLVNVYINHHYQRMSDSAYYSNYCQNSILFHNHFLHEFNDIFEKYPKKKMYHLEALVNNYFYTNQYKAGWKQYFELLKIGFSFKNLIRPFYVIFRKKFIKYEK
jgi:glycosyltransferase involved in cell wall biosynthesis